MNLELMLYLADIVENLQKATSIISLISLAVVAISTFGFIANSDDNRGKEAQLFLRILKRFAVSLLVAGFGFLILPKQKTIYVIIGIHTAKEIVDNPQVKALSGRVFDVLNRKLDELDPPKKDEK